MPDATQGAPPAGPDFLDRLLARHTPAAAARPGVTRVRPRLAGPFERIEAIRSTTADPDDSAPLWPVAAPDTVHGDDPGRPAVHEVRRHTEHERTVVRTERAPAPEPVSRPAPRTEREAPLLRPTAPVLPGPRPVPGPARGGAGRGHSAGNPSPGPESAPIPPGTDSASTAAVSAALFPSAADTAAARNAVRQAAARRPGRGAEQMVQVQIGRLEVTAGGAPSRAARPGQRAAGRPETALGLAEYLRGERP